MKTIRILACTLILSIVLIIIGIQYKEAGIIYPITIPNITLNITIDYNYYNPKVYVYSQFFEDLYKLGLEIPAYAESNFSKPFIVLEKGNRTLL